MIVLDTNVLSELMKARPSPVVLDWLLKAGVGVLCTTVACQAEILVGIATLPAGKKREDLAANAKHVFRRAFLTPILPFDSRAAEHFADIVATRRRLGRRIEPLDAMVAAIARANGAAVATRNVTDFRDCGVLIHDPWADG